MTKLFQYLMKLPLPEKRIYFCVSTPSTLTPLSLSELASVLSS